MRALIAGLVLTLAACGGSGSSGVVAPPPPPPLKPDPYLTIRIRDLMDTTTAPGRSLWHIFAVLTGPYTAQNGIAYQGNTGLPDIRLGHNIQCVSVGADSVGQRLITVIALADTTATSLPYTTPDSVGARLSVQWYAGNRTLPSGWMALTFAPQDAWQSAQYTAGHGLTHRDPIKWGVDWTGAGVTSFYERTDSDPTCSVF